ncbi:fimbrial biogenesis chaperone [Cupriavidus plantarum]|uniref:fimbrial biogenesis chaperone n=1 Tax=Cupriavidus plantarum TaxID=942865 RepID=UPI000E223EB3|nr:molecular chaperone [Cupriavidus plantarum]REE91093.1 fimbrial chaperone protein [Cupriavidus plantarum]
MRHAAIWRRPDSATLLALVLAALAAVCPAHATSLQITPVRIDLPAGAGAAALTLRNQGNTPIHAQVRVFRWTQDTGSDALAATEEIVASPPIVRIPGGSDQLVRIVRPARADAGANHAGASDPGISAAGESAYRLLIDELPAPGATPDASGVRLQLRYSVPVFAGTPSTTAPPPLRLNLWRDGSEGGWTLAVRNAGQRHARLSDIALVNGGQRINVGSGLFGYALPGAVRVWKINLPASFAPAATMRLDGAVNGEPQSLPVTAGRP